MWLPYTSYSRCCQRHISMEYTEMQMKLEASGRKSTLHVLIALAGSENVRYKRLYHYLPESGCGHFRSG